MIDLSRIDIKNLCPVKLPNSKIISVYEPKVKSYKKLLKQSNKADLSQNEFNEICLTLSVILSSNKENYKIDVQFIENALTMSQVQELLNGIMEFYQKIKEIKN